MHPHYLLAFLLTFALWLPGCPSSDDDQGDDDQGDDDTGDDDTGDDDTGDDDTGDDDTGDDDTGDDDTGPVDADGDGYDESVDCDDNDATVYPGALDIWGDGVDQDCDGIDPSVPYYRLEVAIDATGGAIGGTATLTFKIVLIDASVMDVCSTTFEFISDYGFGPNQGPDLWVQSDEVITFNSFQVTGGTCEEGAILGYMYENDPVVEWQYLFTPMSFISCDAIRADPSLYQLFIGDDPWGGQLIDGTLGAYCDYLGPIWQSSFGTGPMEGVWLRPGPVGFLDSAGNYDYLLPPSQANVESYFITGLLMADLANPNEPATLGLEGSYIGADFWTWMF